MKGRVYMTVLTLITTWTLATPSLAQEEGSGQAQLLLEDLRTFTDVFNQVRMNYVEELDDMRLLDAAIRGIIAELDEHSRFISADSFREMDDASRGRFGGIGVEVEFEDGRIIVVGVPQGSPANAAGIRPGDLITAVGGRPVKGRAIPETMDALRGEPGTDVRVGVSTPGQDSRELVLTRAFIAARSVESRVLEDRFGYFRISHFHAETGKEMEASVRRLAGQDGSRLAGAIIDLRGNGGGAMNAAAAVADGFLDSGQILHTESRHADMDMEFTASPGEWLPGRPLVVLVDEKSASASEVLAGALQDHGRAVIVGRTTFGKGSVQSVLAMRNGSGLRLTTARYFTASGNAIEGVGIEPDVPVTGDSGQALEKALEILRQRAAG